MHLSAENLFLLSQCAISAAYQAGHMIAKQSVGSYAVTSKQGGSSIAAQVVTEVDHLSQNIILHILRPVSEMFDLALLSEESPDDRQRLEKDYFWCIDPLDGTLPFIERVSGYSVAIGLVSKTGTAMLGVVYDPLSQTLYHAIKDQGIYCNHQPLTAKSLPSTNDKLIFLTDKSFAQEPLYQATLKQLDQLATNLGYAGAILTLQGGAAMNACQVLTGLAHCYFKLPKTQTGGGSIWDYAATTALFETLGYPVSDMHGKPFNLNPDGSLFMNHCGVLYCTDAIIAEQMLQRYQGLLAI